MVEPVFRTIDTLEAGLAAIQSPCDDGRLEAIVIRPTTNQRISLDRCRISYARGVHGDSWAAGSWKRLPDGKPDPDVQVCIANAQVIDLIAAGHRERWPLAGDNLYIDFDISHESQRPGQRLAIGESILEITDQAHNGCKKFAARFGDDALAFVNSELGQERRLRGIYARVVQDGEIAVGDVIRRV